MDDQVFYQQALAASLIPEAEKVGYRGPGWYFVDETGAYAHGPYPDRAQAVEAQQAYGVSLGE